jgi:hypothetical protein
LQQEQATRRGGLCSTARLVSPSTSHPCSSVSSRCGSIACLLRPPVCVYPILITPIRSAASDPYRGDAHWPCPVASSSRRFVVFLSSPRSHSLSAVCPHCPLRVHPAHPPRLPANGPPSTTSSPASTPSTCTSAPTTSASRRVSRHPHRRRPILWHAVLRCALWREEAVFIPCFSPYVLHALLPSLPAIAFVGCLAMAWSEAV